MRMLGLLLLVGCNSGGVSTPQANGWNGGLVVHEWGTHTFVVGSDGTQLRGLHHEEEDLPGFVYDRIKQGETVGPVIDKMETPVLYFYSPAARAMKVSVDFPRGVLTQWYPLAKTYYPLIARVPDGWADPTMDPHFAFAAPTCAAKFSVEHGLLDWGEVQLLGRDASPALPEASLDRYSWSHARKVAANAITVGDQAEKFLFYRGLGNLAQPAKLSVSDRISVDAGGPLFVMKDGRFSTDGSLPSAGDVDELAAAVTAALDQTGLYHDEAQAMVATWKRQWFTTPGLRALYLAPRAWTDAELPLHLDPTPDELVRVMVIRVELITPDEESADVLALQKLGDPSTAPDARAHFLALGRFAEPHLRRAMQLASNPAYAQPFVDEIAGVDVSSAGD